MKRVYVRKTWSNKLTTCGYLSRSSNYRQPWTPRATLRVTYIPTPSSLIRMPTYT